MKINKHFAWMAAGALVLSATSCVNDNSFEGQTPQEEIDMTGVYGNGSKIVTLNITPETTVGTRADGTLNHISDGKKATSLYFEVYEVTDGETVIEDPEAAPASRAEETTCTEAYVSLDTSKPVKVEDYKATIKLAVDPEKNYRISLWASNSELVGGASDDKLFTLSSTPLSVKVNYAKATNNYENMDAFCATTYFTGKTESVNVILHRPFAQLNVGTTGADYKNYMEGNIYPNKIIKYSKVVVKGIQNQLDIANDKISKTNDFDPSDEGIEFAFAKIPAFINYTTNNGFPSNLLGETNSSASSEQDPITPNKDEEFLKVNLNDPTNPEYELKGYKTVYPTYDASKQAKEKYLTETFKYMSMCYVLVPADIVSEETQDQLDDVTWNGNTIHTGDKYKSSTLTSVEVYFASKETSGDYDGHQYFTVKNVPVHRNWRTNLLGGLKNTDPDDPNGPDDDTSLFYNTKIQVQLCPIYWGEFNGLNSNDPENEDHYDGINAGWFPTESNKDLHDQYGEHHDEDHSAAAE